MKQFFKFMFASCLGTLIVFALGTLLLFGLVGTLSSSLFSEKTVAVQSNSVLEISLDKAISEKESSELEMLISGTTSVGLNSILKSIKEAKTDPQIKGIYLRGEMGEPLAGWASMEEIRNALIDFKKSRKFVIAYSSNYSQKAYYLATAADRSFIHPSGIMLFTGLSAEMVFLKDLLQKFEIDVELIRPKSNEYKSAGEMFILNKMSEANREQVREYMQSIWNNTVKNIAQARGIEEIALNKIADNLSGFSAEGVVSQKLIDAAAFESAVLDTIKNRIGNGNGELNTISPAKYAKALKQKTGKIADDEIAIVYAYGDVVDGKGVDAANIYSDNLVETLREVAENKAVKAIVLRINSPGGSAIASESITNEIFAIAAKKPIVASFSDVAASAGYEMACGATKIVAQPNTITGSIGVFGVVPNFGKMLKSKLGINFDTVNTNRNSTGLSVLRPLSPEMKAAMENNVESFYKLFCTRVATGRKLTVAHVDSIGRGRVWSGADAVKIGLVDQLGGIDDAIVLAAELAKTESYFTSEYPKGKDTYTQMMELFDTEARTRLMNSIGNGNIQQFYKELRTISEIQGIQARLPYLIHIN